MVSHVRVSFAFLAALVVVSAAMRPAAANPIVPSYIYGIADDNWIWQTNPAPGQQSFEQTFNTGLTGQSNAVAFDRGRDQLFFLDVSNNLYMWNKPLGGSPSAFQQITTSGSLGITSSLVYNASYYDNGFWFFKEATNELVKASLSYSGTTPGTVPTFTTTTSYTLTGPTPATDNGFGDIAINEVTGMLYAATSTGYFYTANLASPNPDTTYNEIKGPGGNISLQLAFNEDFSVLYGHNYGTGKWYTVDPATGNTTDLNFITLVDGFGFRDLAGASPIDATPVPEIDSASIGGVIALLVAALAWLERRSMRRLAAFARV